MVDVVFQKPLWKHFLLADSGNLRQLGVTEITVSHRRRMRGILDVKVVFCGRLLSKTPLLSSLQGFPDAVPAV